MVRVALIVCLCFLIQTASEIEFTSNYFSAPSKRERAKISAIAVILMDAPHLNSAFDPDTYVTVCLLYAPSHHARGAYRDQVQRYSRECVCFMFTALA